MHFLLSHVALLSLSIPTSPSIHHFIHTLMATLTVSVVVTSEFENCAKDLPQYAFLGLQYQQLGALSYLRQHLHAFEGASLSPVKIDY